MSCHKLFDCIIVALVGSDGLSFLDLRLDGGFAAKIMGSVFFEKLLKKRVLGHEAMLSRGDIPIIRLNTISIGDSRIGGRMRGIISEALSSTSLGVMDAGKYVESDRTGLVHHPNRIITNGAVMGQTCENSCCRIGIMLDRRREGISNDEKSVGDTVNVRMRYCSQRRRCRRIQVGGIAFE